MKRARFTANREFIMYGPTPRWEAASSSLKWSRSSGLYCGVKIRKEFTTRNRFAFPLFHILLPAAFLLRKGLCSTTCSLAWGTSEHTQQTGSLSFPGWLKRPFSRPCMLVDRAYITHLQIWGWNSIFVYVPILSNHQTLEDILWFRTMDIIRNFTSLYIVTQLVTTEPHMSLLFGVTLKTGVTILWKDLTRYYVWISRRRYTRKTN